MTEMATRALTGAAYVALTVGAAYAGPLTTTLLFLPVCALAVGELYRLAYGAARPPLALPLFTSLLVYLATAAAGMGQLPVQWAAAAIVVAFTVGLIQLLADDRPDPLRRTGLLLCCIASIALPFGLITLLLADGPGLFLGFMILLWTNDTGAYLVGRAIGRTKLLPRISPKKTVEGLLGGVVLAMAVGVALAQAWPVLARWQWIVCALVVAVCATIGDLLESALKRSAGVKDSGTVLPGHGGILDRFDGFLLALPAMVVCVACLRG
jgi:phosphatidate cytidylyltransferase